LACACYDHALALRANPGKGFKQERTVFKGSRMGQEVKFINEGGDRLITDYPDVPAMLRQERPHQPVYCIYPEVYRRAARAFVSGFPGRVLYAVKANDHPVVVQLLHAGGVMHFDCASVPEIALVAKNCPGATSYFMVPTRLRGAAREAFERYGVRHFMIDHASGIDILAGEVNLRQAVVFTRMAVHHDAAKMDLSTKFGAPPEQVAGLMISLAGRGAEPALAFNVGSSVMRTEAYTYALGVARDVLAELPFPVRLVDIGGGFPYVYPGFPAPPLQDYFSAVEQAARTLPLPPGAVIMAEPGRALAAPGLSAVVEVLLRRDDRLYLNDGMYGIFWELRFREHDAYPFRAFRDGKPLQGDTLPFRLFGPTCDSTDVLPAAFALPADIRPGDYIEFGSIGAYSLSGRTQFNGYFSDRIVKLGDSNAQPPGV
jgi:ornithine decarboxylase